MHHFAPEIAVTTIPMVTQLDVSDFQRRWQAARLAALRQGGETAPESALLPQRAPTQDPEVLKGVYYNARKFGHSALRYFALLWDTDDVRDVLSQADVPCLQGQWHTDGSTVVVERQGCGLPQQCGAWGCDYWQEAIDGLLMGLGDTVRHTRHRSAGHGDAGCRDVFTPGEAQQVAYGPVPAEMAQTLATLAQQYVPTHIEVRFVGYAAGVVYYQVITPDTGCGPRLWPTIFQRAVTQAYPSLRLQDLAPSAVLR